MAFTFSILHIESTLILKAACAPLRSCRAVFFQSLSAGKLPTATCMLPIVSPSCGSDGLAPRRGAKMYKTRHCETLGLPFHRVHYAGRSGWRIQRRPRRKFAQCRWPGHLADDLRRKRDEPPYRGKLSRCCSSHEILSSHDIVMCLSRKLCPTFKGGKAESLAPAAQRTLALSRSTPPAPPPLASLFLPRSPFRLG